MNEFQVVALIQARMGSTRLPGKSLKEVMGKPLLGYLVERVRRCKKLNDIVIATTDSPVDDCLARFARNENLSFFRGSEIDVLDRFYQAATLFKADVVVRITGDCPLIDPVVVDEAISYFLDQYPLYDYVNNIAPRRYPRGMDTEVFTYQALLETWKRAGSNSEREHVTPFIYLHPELFRLGHVSCKEDLSSHRWTVDTPEDFALVKKILEYLYPKNPEFTIQDILRALCKNPEWVQINAHIQQKSL
jgi:spore coat polysaccharide biosynthesis protein SpsF